MQVIRDMSNHGQSGERPFYEFLESCLRHKAEMVILEAARAITELDGVTSRELTPAITVLQLFLSSPKPVLRFAAVRTLNKVYNALLIKVFINNFFNSFIVYAHRKDVIVFWITSFPLPSRVKKMFHCTLNVSLTHRFR